ncbi:MAG TPA: FCD domain-containing protein, partial [Noviherbaspirillum sp.]
SNFNQDKWDNAVKEHGAMLDALERRDGNALRLILQQHLRNKRDAVIAVLCAAQASAPQD